MSRHCETQKVTADAAEPTVTALRTLPEPFGSKVPSDPETAARLNAAVQVGGGLLLATGKLPRIASVALAFTVIPGSVGAHLFWHEYDPDRKAQKRRDLLTDLSLLGGLIIASADTAGEPSLGWRGRRAAGRISEAVSAALPLDGSDGTVLDSELAEKIAHSLHIGAERGRELASTAVEKSGPLVEAARGRVKARCWRSPADLWDAPAHTAPKTPLPVQTPQPAARRPSWRGKAPR